MMIIETAITSMQSLKDEDVLKKLVSFLYFKTKAICPRAAAISTIWINKISHYQRSKKLGIAITLSESFSFNLIFTS